jgi:hypothetical protein
MTPGPAVENAFDVHLNPPFHGCLIAFATVFSLGTYPLFRRHVEGKFIRRMDDQGVEARSGKRVAWSEFTSARRVAATLHGAQLSDELLLESRRGRVSLALWRIDRPQEALAYLSRRLPPGIAR